MVFGIIKCVGLRTTKWEMLQVNNKKVNGSILLLEDEDMVREIASEMLSFIGYEVVCATEGAQAIELYGERYHAGAPFTAVIMDLSIPNGMGGEEAVAEVLRIDPDAKVIVSSGSPCRAAARGWPLPRRCAHRGCGA